MGKGHLEGFYQSLLPTSFSLHYSATNLAQGSSQSRGLSRAPSFTSMTELYGGTYR